MYQIECCKDLAIANKNLHVEKQVAYQQDQVYYVLTFCMIELASFLKRMIITKMHVLDVHYYILILLLLLSY